VEETGKGDGARGLELRTKRDKLLILLVALIVVVGIVDYFLFRELGRDKGPPQEKEEVKQDVPADRIPESSRGEGTWLLEEEAERKTESVVSPPSNQEQLSPELRSDEPSLFEESDTTEVDSEIDTTASSHSNQSELPAEPQTVEPSPIEDHDVGETPERSTEASLVLTREETAPVTIEEAEFEEAKRPVIQGSAIALAVEDREPRGISDRVSVRERRVYCWLHVVDGQGEKVTVRWVQNGHEMSEAHLSVGSNNWRTWSYITLTPDMIGPAQVEILEDDRLLKTLSFEITE